MNLLEVENLVKTAHVNIKIDKATEDWQRQSDQVASLLSEKGSVETYMRTMVVNAELEAKNADLRK